MLVESGDVFESGAPSKQALVDVFKGQWKTAFPDSFGVEAGTQPYFDDTRVQWTADRIGGLAGKRALELGPFEAYNTVHLCEAGAERVVAVEANRINFLKCLIVKEMFGIHANFELGDFIAYLEDADETFDLCFASGVLYHQTEPLRFLRAAAAVAPALFIWTHYYDGDLLRTGDNWKYFEDLPEGHETDGDFSCTLYKRSYLFKESGKVPRKFSGGLSDYAHWMRYDDLIGYLEYLGLDDIEIRARTEHPAGPVVSLLAKRS